LISICTSNIN